MNIVPTYIRWIKVLPSVKFFTLSKFLLKIPKSNFYKICRHKSNEISK